MSTLEEDLIAEYRRRRGGLTPPTMPMSSAGLLRPGGGIGSDYDPLEASKSFSPGGGGNPLNNIGSAFKAIGRGITSLPTFAGKTAQSVVGLGEFVVDTGADIIPGVEYTSRWERDKEKAKALGLSGIDQIAYAAQRQYPLASMIIPSAVDTAGRAAELGSYGLYNYGQPGVDFATAYRQGTLGALLVEDLGNIILVGRGLGAGNVLTRAGEGIGAAGAPRLGRVISTGGRIIEEPIGSTVRGTARVGQFLAEGRGATGIGSRLGRIAQAGIGETPGPLRQLISEARDVRQLRGVNNVARLVQQYKALDEQLSQPGVDAGTINREMNVIKNQLISAVGQTGIISKARKEIVVSQILEEAKRTNLQTEMARLKTLGPSVVFPDAEPGPMPDYASPVAILIKSGRMEIIMREIADGATPEELSAQLTPTGIGPDLENIGYRFTPADIQAAVDYQNGTISKFGRQSIDAVVQFYTRHGDEFTRGELSGEYRLGGPMPKTYVQNYPIAEFLIGEIEKGRFGKERIQLINFLDDAAIQFIETLPAELRDAFKQTPQNPTGAFKALMEHPELGFVAQQLIELTYPQLLRAFPNAMRDAMIYPARMRPNIMAEARLLRVARSKDIATIVRGMAELADRYGNLLGKKLVESIRADLENLVDTPQAYLPGSYTRILRKLNNLQIRVREQIVELQANQEKLTADKQLTINNLIEAEARLGAMQTTVRALVDNLNRIPDEELPGVAQALEQVDLSAEKKRIAEDAIRTYERRAAQDELALTPDERQVIIDEIEQAQYLYEGYEYAQNLETLIDEFEYRRNLVESGKVDPTTVEPKPYTNRSKEVKAFRDEMLRVAEDVVKTAFSREEAFQTGQTISWNAWAVDSDNIFGMPLREAMVDELARWLPLEDARKLADEWAGGRYGNEGYVYSYDEFGINNDRGVGGKGLDDWVQVKGNPLLDEGGQPELRESSYGSFGSTARPDEWSTYIRAMADVYKAEQEVTRIKKLRLYEIADEMNRNRSARDFETSGYSLPVLARAIAYLTNPNLLTADLRLADRYASEMEAGIPYEGAQPRLIPIPKELLENLRRADRDVTNQQRTVDRLRKEGTAEQRRIVRGQLKGVGKIVEQPDGTVEGQLLKGPQTKAEAEIAQAQNKDLYLQKKLDDLRQQYMTQTALLGDVRAVGQAATAVEQQMAKPFGPLLLGEDSQIGYLPAGLPSTARGATRVGTELRTEGAAPQVKSPTEQMRTSDVMPLRLDDMTKRLDEIFSVVGRNKTLEDIIKNPEYSIPMSRLITGEQLKAIVAKAQQDVMQQGLVRTPGDIDARVRELVGIELAKIARQAGYEPISPVKVDPVTGAHEAVGDLLQTVPDTVVDTNTMLMQFGMRERLTQQFVVQGKSNMPEYVMKVLNASNKLTTNWKQTVLPFSVRWQIGDLVSNVLNAWAQGDVPVGEMIRRMQEVDALLTSSGKRLEVLGGSLQNDLFSVLIGAGLQARGLRDIELQMSRGLNPRAQIADLQIEGPFPKLRQTPGFRMFPGFREKSFRFNEYQNTLARTAMAMYVLEKTLAEQGRSIDEITHGNYVEDAQIRDAVNNAVRRTNDALGAFTELSPFEKNVVRNIYPFWSWIRYINKAALKMAIDSPDRVLFATALGSIASDPENNGLFGFLEGRIPMLGYYFDMSFLNPYQDAILFAPDPIKAAQDQLGSISPGISLPFNAAATVGYYATGKQLSLPGQQISRPGYLEGRPGATTRTLGDLFGELGYLGLTTMGGPFRNVLTLGPTGERIPYTDVALGNVQRFPQGSARTEGRYAAQRLNRPASIASALLGTIGVPRPLISQDVAQQQSLLQSIADIQAQQRRERERLLSRIGQ